MNHYSYQDFIDLHVKDRITRADAKRQTRTAKEIIRRLHDQPGIILADEVGMGKTFVALAVAISFYHQDPGKSPIVIMVPPSLKDKWPRDFKLFRNRCIAREHRKEFRYAKAEKAEAFLKLLDDPPERRKSLVFLTHGAMSRGLTDGWIKLAIIQRSLYRRRNIHKTKLKLYRTLGALLNMKWIEKNDPGIWEHLLKTRPDKWLKVLHRFRIDPENDNDPLTDDDPVPMALVNVFDKIRTDKIFKALDQIPYRRSKYWEQHIKHARRILNEELRTIWDICLRNIDEKLPLLIMDEAHHLKNARTRLASLFETRESEHDSRLIQQNGPLAGMFERMLFLTATPFQLGHNELCNILDRFSGISWNTGTAPPEGYNGFKHELDLLLKSLDETQIYALELDKAWNKLGPLDLIINNECCSDVNRWWEKLNENPPEISDNIRPVYEKYTRLKETINKTQRKLRKWVIRHNKSKFFQYTRQSFQRRNRLNGSSIIEDKQPKTGQDKGIRVEQNALLPFLLSARLSALKPHSRPVFAEGLASSYEAFLHTRTVNKSKNKSDYLDLDDEKANVHIDDSCFWYLEQLEKLLPEKQLTRKQDHPKIKTTIKKAIDLWAEGEKVLIFCHYIATGKSLRNHISRALTQIILSHGAKKLNCPRRKVFDELDKIGNRFLKENTIIRRSVDKELENMINKYPSLSETGLKSNLVDSIRRYLRTPSFLIRYFPLRQPRMDEKTFLKALERSDKSGITLRKTIENFLNFLETKCDEPSRKEYIEALTSIQPGGIKRKDISSSYDLDELKEIDKKSIDILQPNVRLVYGATKQAARQKIMLTFNTPFYPEILVTSSVLAEGVDLHLNCRHVIHHDLCWNPSTLEQRTGRIDRIGSKSEQCLEPINIYIPFIAETQDEKMYRVVMDRERWFKIVLGEEYKADYLTNEKLAERIPLPETVLQELTFKLGL